MGECSWVGIVPLLVLLGIPAVLVAVRRYKMKGEDLFAYSTKNPDCVKGDRVICRDCGGDEIVEHQLTKNRVAHTCKACGALLYKSKK